MNGSIVRASLIAVVVCVGVTGIIAQQRGVPAADKYKISAKAGMVNHSEGLTSVTRPDGTTGTLISGDQLEARDRVQTSAGGMAEVLLNPGSYLRLGGESEFSFRTTSLDDLRLDIHRGSAILEVFASDQFRVSAYTPRGRVTIVHSGVYRVDVTANGNGLLSVIEGQAVIGEKTIAVVKSGKTGTIDGGAVAIAKFDKNERDTLASWSRSRSKDLAKMSAAFNARNTRPLITDSLISSYAAGIWGRSRTMGVWVFDRFSRTCIFMPFFEDWLSPYGFGYRSCLCNYYLPREIRPVDPPIRLDRRKEIVFEGNRSLGNGSDTNSKGVDFRVKERVVFEQPPPPPPPVTTLPTKKPIINN